MKLLKTALLSASILVAASAQALTVFQTTDGDVNYLFQQDANGMISFTSEALSNLYVFNYVAGTNYSDLNAANGVLLKPQTTTSVNFEKFIFALQADNTFVGPNSITKFGTANSYQLTFANGSAIIADVQEVPVPAAAWLFGSAMLGLAGVKRRK